MQVQAITNCNESTYENGYDSDSKLPYYHATTDLGEDPSMNYEDYFLMTALVRD